MDSISNILSKYKVIQPVKASRPKQMKLFQEQNYYHQAKDFAKKYDISVYFILKLIKKYGASKVLGLNSWLADYPVKGNYYGLIVWKLKKDCQDKKLCC